MNKVVVYDACILFSPALRDLLMYLFAVDAVEARWSERIQEEWIRSVLKRRPHVTRKQLEKAKKAMNERFPEGLVTGYEYLIETLQLPDLDDRHVLAVAIHSGASVIVTNNLNDFQSFELSRRRIKAVSPDEFLDQWSSVNPAGVLDAAREHRASLTRPSKTVDEFLVSLEKQKLSKTVAFLREHRNEI